MFALWYLLLASLSVCVVANRVYPPTKAIKLTLGISKATYLQFETTSVIQDGCIMEKLNADLNIAACTICKKWTAKSYEKKDTEVLMFKNTQQKLVVFGFRGTEPTIEDWLKNFDMKPASVTIDKTMFHIHKGFRDRFDSIASWFEKEYKRVPHDYTIVITGHSLGGAEATIAAVFAAGKLKRRPDAVITYGSPLVGAQNFKDYYNQVVGCDRTIRMKARKDLVTVVPMVFGYTHVCSKTEVDGKTGLDLVKAHDLYDGYDQGIDRKYLNVNEINFGCDQVLN